MNNVEWFEKPIVKKAAEMQAGDIYECEFGDYDNWVRVVFEKCEPDGRNTKIFFHTLSRSDSRVMYDLDPIEKVCFSVVGKIV